MSLTLLGTHIPEGYFSRFNIETVSNTITDILNSDFDHPVIINDEDIKRVMLRVLEARLEPTPLMLRRVIMEIVSEFKEFELERTKNLRLEKYYHFTQNIYDVSARKGPDLSIVKLSKQPSTLRFYHTFGTPAFFG
jgi:hypothetical protein